MSGSTTTGYYGVSANYSGNYPKTYSGNYNYSYNRQTVLGTYNKTNVSNTSDKSETSEPKTKPQSENYKYALSVANYFIDSVIESDFFSVSVQNLHFQKAVLTGIIPDELKNTGCDWSVIKNLSPNEKLDLIEELNTNKSDSVPVCVKMPFLMMGNIFKNDNSEELKESVYADFEALVNDENTKADDIADYVSKIEKLTGQPFHKYLQQDDIAWLDNVLSGTSANAINKRNIEFCGLICKAIEKASSNKEYETLKKAFTNNGKNTKDLKDFLNRYYPDNNFFNFGYSLIQVPKKEEESQTDN